MVEPRRFHQKVIGETARPFALVIIGGLISGTVLTLFILPLLYPWFESRQDEQLAAEIERETHRPLGPQPPPAA
ncbi:MAG: hypothetical protein ABSH38_07250 [Verrucomicrobiota bacterium]|jgi:preprotein translocase subunit SecF